MNNKISIIPKPFKLEKVEGYFHLSKKTTIYSDTWSSEIGDYLWQLLSPFGVKKPIPEAKWKDTITNAIILKKACDLGLPENEGYRLSIGMDRIILEATSMSGLFYGVQTLRQLLPPEIEGGKTDTIKECNVQCLEIEDFPRFKWRGFMLDESRHFFGKESVKRILDLLALHKINIFHWHLTDDQGWRIEIKKYPLLTEIGSKRKDTQINGRLSKKRRGLPHKGFYTQEDIKEIVAYALERHITIVPEIDIPGHTTAALAAYPEYSCTGGPFRVKAGFGIFPDILCAGQASTYSFIQDIFDEVLDLFPSKYIHVGGDEAPKKRWKECPFCQNLMKKQGLNDVKELHCYFTNQVAQYLLSKGRIPIGWNEILHDKLLPGTIGQYWLGRKKKVISHIEHQRDFIISNFFYLYLDYTYAFIPLKKAYCFEPVPKELKKDEERHILGIEAPLWSEFVPDRKRFDWQIFPRLTAVAETAWSQKDSRVFSDFLTRLETFNKRLDHMGVGYAGTKTANPGFFRQIFGWTTALSDPYLEQRRGNAYQI